MCVGDEIELVTPGSVGRPLTVTPLLDENREPIEATSHPYMQFYMQMPFAVKAGDIIGAVGNSSLAKCTKAPHLHFEVCYNEENVDPTQYFMTAGK
jgi:hypothetical protein